MTRVDRLGSGDRAGLEALLLVDPVANLYPLGHTWALAGEAAPDGPIWLGARSGRSRELLGAALLHPGGLAVPWAPDPLVAAALGAAARAVSGPALCVGPREAVDAFWHAFVGDAPPAAWFDQRLMVADEPLEAVPVAGLQRARAEHLPLIIAAADRMEREDTGYSPLATDPDAHVRACRHRVWEGRTWIVPDPELGLAFLVHVGVPTTWGVQVGGTWVPPERRGAGLATRAMAHVTARLLERAPRVTLHVREANVAAVRAYRRAGYRPDMAFRLARPGPAR